MFSFIWSIVIKQWPKILLGIGLLLLTIVPSLFEKPKVVRVEKGGMYTEASDGLEPTFGCATGRQFLGWAHKK